MPGVVMGKLRPCRIAVGVAVVGLALAGCSSSPSFSSLFGSSKLSTDASAAATAAQLFSDFECPAVSVRQGAATLAVTGNPGDQSALNMRYQVSIGQTARECRLVGTTVTMKVGVQGRVVLGPAGGPGQLDVPLRLAVVHEGTTPKTIATKLQRIKVDIPGADNVLFTHIEEDLSFPMPRGADIDSYVVYVGFDPIGAKELEKKKPAPKPRRTS
jgi:hypothetical protein